MHKNKGDDTVKEHISPDFEAMDEVLVKQYEEDISLLESKLEELDINYKGMIEREAHYLQNIERLQKYQNVDNVVSSGSALHDHVKLQQNYEGLLARETRYLKEIQQLKGQLLTQKESLHKTYSYRLGYLLIHSTKSFKNFVNLPADLIRLYLDNKRRKNPKMQKQGKKRGAISNKLTQKTGMIPYLHKSIDETIIEAGRDQVKIATIMDEFTSFCFAPEAEILQLTPDNFVQELEEFKPDLLFIESAWQGKDGLWKLKISHQADELLALIEYCRTHHIKTLFWNKEDPVHFGTFIEVAKLVDVVFTTDIDCIKKYKEVVQHDAVYLLPFAAQPKTHNPIELYDRLDKFNFAGSYYLKYPVRQRDFSVLSGVALQRGGLDIYDRNFSNAHPHYQFPERYEPLILGSLAPEEIDRAYKGYEFGINMNTIKQSQTMFARRVFEMLASNTIVLSNYSRGVRLFFGDLVICSDNREELIRQIDHVGSSELQRKKFKLQGLRSIFSQHTYEHRLNYILQKLRITKTDGAQTPHIVVIAKCDTAESVERVIAQFNAQTIHNKILLIETKVIVKTGHNVRIFADQDALMSALNKLLYTHVALFKETDYYGAHYLGDLLHSYHYLKYHGNIPVTKSHYYSYTQDALVERAGTEYQFVNNYSTIRTLYTQADFIALLEHHKLSYLLDGLLIKGTAFAGDCLSYIQNGYQADSQSRALICDDLILDSGVNLTEHLLPISEKITGQPLEKQDDIILNIDQKLVKESLRKEIVLSIRTDHLQFLSQLPLDQHRLIALTQPVDISGWNRATLRVDIVTQGDVLFVFEFLDANKQQLSNVSLSANKQFSLDIPAGTVYGKLSLRIKGTADVTLGNEFKLALENVTGLIESQTYESDDIRLFTKDDMDAQLVRPKSKQINIRNNREGLAITSSLPDDKHAYLYFKEIFTRADINLETNSLYEATGTTLGCEVSAVFVFLDEQQEKLSHSIIKIDNFSHAMAIPEACKYVRIGFKVTGSGEVVLDKLRIGELREKVNCLIGKSDTLVLAKQYPAYDDLYKYGFLHSRLRAYKKENVIVDMFRFVHNGKADFREFESIDVTQGSREELRDTLASGQYKRVFIHIVDKAMWDVVKEFRDEIEIYIWLHGAEIQTWQRRSFEFDLMTPDQISRQKRLSADRVKFWQKLLDEEANEKVNFIFVSNYLREESEEGLNRKFPDARTAIIHNYVDENVFPYTPKQTEQRFKLLTIRPFVGKKYANDITVNAILELSQSPQFSKFQIEICGDGDLFDETVAPLKSFENVEIHKGFLSHAEMAKKYRDYGVFINPTRWDSQGVSRDEARIAGLISVSSNITAIPEFVSEDDGILVEVEDYKTLSDKLLWLVDNPDEFAKMSLKGRNRVLQQCSLENTIEKELAYIDV